MPIWKMNFSSRFLRLSVVPRSRERPQIAMCSLDLSPHLCTTESHNSSIRSDEGLTLETSDFRISVRWPIYIINSVDKTKFLYTKVTVTGSKQFCQVQLQTEFVKSVISIY